MSITARILTMPGDESRLRRQAKTVKNPQNVILEVQSMKDAALQWESDTKSRCEGLAAPQIGVNLRIIIVRRTNELAPPHPGKEPLLNDFDEVDKYRLAAREFVKARALHADWQRNASAVYDPWHVMINPTLLTTEGVQKCEGEGCLSVPGYHGTTVRPEKLTFRYTDMAGKRSNIVVTVNAHAAQVICHELNHLSGVLFTDAAIEIKKDTEPYDDNIKDAARSSEPQEHAVSESDLTEV